MLYQKILTEDSPFNLSLDSLGGFTEHRHADIEFNYCIKGSREIIIEKKKYIINEGDMSVIAPGVAHEFPQSDDGDRLVLTGVVGASFLKKYFSAFSGAEFASSVISLKSEGERTELKHSLDEIAHLLNEKSVRASLLINGELYKVCAYLSDELCTSADSKSDTTLAAVQSIDEALELIYYKYKTNVSVEEAAAVTGYGKSNFCRIFKKTTGLTFHEALNKRRTRVACGLLKETELSVSEIAYETGFSDAKSFCRVFRAYVGLTPGTYRRNAADERQASEQMSSAARHI